MTPSTLKRKKEEEPHLSFLEQTQTKNVQITVVWNLITRNDLDFPLENTFCYSNNSKTVWMKLLNMKCSF